MTNPEKLVNGTLSKASGAVQITSDVVSLVQRKCYNVLLYNAFKELSDKDEFIIKLSDLYYALNFNDSKKLIECIKDMMSIRVEFNYLGSRDKKWAIEVMTLLSWVAISENGVYLHYSYAPQLKEKLANPRLYAKINLSIQRRFKTKYALALYELCCDHYMWDKGESFMPFIALSDLRKILGCSDNETYSEYRYFKSKILNKAMTEINDYASFNIRLGKPRRERQAVVAVQFILSSKDSSRFIQGIAVKEQKELPLAPGGKLHRRLVDEFGISAPKAEELVNKFDEKHIEDSLFFVSKKWVAGEIKESSPAGFAIRAIEGNWKATPSLPSPSPKSAGPIFPEITPGMIIELDDGTTQRVNVDRCIDLPPDDPLKPKTSKILVEDTIRKSISTGKYRIVHNDEIIEVPAPE